ncbi:apolipoprotein N-acyltransferase [Microbacterium yannicii]|uniref:apolipoprotein N-acyltransferase n=1 Tax=Microbacterium yannicii TaxID=671622 RepID=UPI00031B8D51|nr:apolipoprotein N-acyltransferase [Microbacterium yannicii]
MPPAVARPPLPLWAAVPVSAAGGLLLDVAFPSVGWWPMAFASVALGLVALIGRSVGGALLAGLAFGLAFYLMNVDFTAAWVGPLPWIALSVLEAAIVAGGAVLVSLAYRWVPRLVHSRRGRMLVTPAVVAGLWTAREAVTGGFPYGGFPWGRVGTSQVSGPLAEVVSWTGTAGLTFLVVFVVAMAIEIVRMPRSRRSRRFADLLPAMSLAVFVAVLAVTPAWATTADGTMRVASIQGNGPAGYFDERRAGDVLETQFEATMPLFGEDDVDVVLWPEGSVDLDPEESPSAASALDTVARRMDAPLVANRIDQRGDEYFNMSFVWREGEGVEQSYDKRNPVPFGEYVPDRGFYQSIAPDLIGMIGRDYTPGSNAPVFDIDGTLGGLAICFDVIYDALIWEGARDGAELYLFQTNNADFRGTDENLQQLAVARLRAIETGRSVVNLSTVGTSQVIAPDGTTIEGLRADAPGQMVTDVPLRTGLTPAVVVGGWVNAVLSWGSVAALAIIGVMVLVRGRRDVKTPAP